MLPDLLTPLPARCPLSLRSIGILCLLLATSSLAPLPTLPAQDDAGREVQPARARRTRQRRPTESDPALAIQEIAPATSSSEAREAIIDAIPIDRLQDHHRTQVETLIAGRPLFRCLPALRIELEPAAYEYYRSHPDMAVAVWKVLGISNLELKKLAPGHYAAVSKDGSRGTIEVLLQTRDLLIIHGTGNWHSGLIPTPIRSQGLVVLRHRFEQDQQGRRFVAHQAAMFLAFPQDSVRNVARLVSPVTNVMADRNFRDISRFLRMMHVASIKKPGWVESIADRLEGISQSERDAFLRTAARSYVSDRRLRQKTRTR